MAHPFSKIFEKALKKCTVEENFVFLEAQKICKKGYSQTEIVTVLTKLKKSLIDDRDAQLVQDAIDTLTLD